LRISPSDSPSDSSDDDTAHSDEPLADAEWLERYQEEMKANEELERSRPDELPVGFRPVCFISCVNN